MLQKLQYINVFAKSGINEQELLLGPLMEGVQFLFKKH